MNALTPTDVNDIYRGLEWLPDGLSGCGAGSVNIDFDVPEGESNLSVAWNYFLSKGLTEAMAAGIIGNLRHESGQSTEDYIIIYPNITQTLGFDAPFDPNDGHGFGIAQWTYSTRKERLQAFAAATGTENMPRPIDDLEMQLDFIWFELTGQPAINGITGGGASTAYSNLTGLITDDPNVDNAPDYEKASYIFHMDYENDDQAITYRGISNPTHDDYLTAHEHRNMLAEDTFNRLSGTGVASANCFANTDGLVNTILSYAWPYVVDGSSNPVAKEEYNAAVRAAISRGEFVGGGAFPGIDCGGYVTRVMRDSGYDPSYNSFEGNTTFQLRYLNESPNWTQITVNSTADLQLGDVAIYAIDSGDSHSGHTLIYIGDEVPGFESDHTEAAYSSSGTSYRPPNAGRQNLLNPIYTWFRKGV